MKEHFITFGIRASSSFLDWTTPRCIFRATMRHVHILLFACPGCNLPVVINRVTEHENMEDVDSESIRLTCSYCGLASGANARTAKKHFAEEWPE